MSELSRRVMLRRIMQASVTLLAVPVLDVAAAEVCVDPSSESLRGSLHYLNPSPQPTELCKGCGFFGADSAKPACGNCQIMSGPVDAGGHCDSWAAK